MLIEMFEKVRFNNPVLSELFKWEKISNVNGFI